MILKLETQKVHDIEMTFLDVQNSWTVTEVFEELRKNPYGIDDAILTKDDILIDVGGNIGMFSIYAHMKYGCRIIAFEPVKENYDNFKRNILLNGLNPKMFEIHNCAITNIDGGEIKIGKFDFNSGGASKCYPYVSNNEICKTETLNKYLTPDCKFLKIDCEGSEYDIIPTIINELNNFDYIGIEYHETQDNSPYKLHEIIKNNFSGKLYPKEIIQVVQLGSYVL